VSNLDSKRSNFHKQRELHKGTKYGVQKIQNEEQKKAIQEAIKCPKGAANVLPKCTIRELKAWLLAFYLMHKVHHQLRHL